MNVASVSSLNAASNASIFSSSDEVVDSPNSAGHNVKAAVSSPISTFVKAVSLSL